MVQGPVAGGGAAARPPREEETVKQQNWSKGRNGHTRELVKGENWSNRTNGRREKTAKGPVDRGAAAAAQPPAGRPTLGARRRRYGRGEAAAVPAVKGRSRRPKDPCFERGSSLGLRGGGDGRGGGGGAVGGAPSALLLPYPGSPPVAPSSQCFGEATAVGGEAVKGRSDPLSSQGRPSLPVLKGPPPSFDRPPPAGRSVPKARGRA